MYYHFVRSKMSSFERNKCHMRKLLIYLFNMNKFTVKAYRLLKQTRGEDASSEESYRELTLAAENVTKGQIIL